MAGFTCSSSTFPQNLTLPAIIPLWRYRGTEKRDTPWVSRRLNWSFINSFNWRSLDCGLPLHWSRGNPWWCPCKFYTKIYRRERFHLRLRFQLVVDYMNEVRSYVRVLYNTPPGGVNTPPPHVYWDTPPLKRPSCNCNLRPLNTGTPITY